MYLDMLYVGLLTKRKVKMAKFLFVWLETKIQSRSIIMQKKADQLSAILTKAW